jgi:hypothetical protein
MALHAEEESISSLLSNFLKLDLDTDRGIAGAIRYSKAISKLGYMISDLKDEVSGLIGEALSPMIEELNKYILKNKELIQEKLGEWATTFGEKVKKVLDYLKDENNQKEVLKFLTELKDAFTDIAIVLKDIALLIGPILKALVTIEKTSISSLPTFDITGNKQPFKEIMGKEDRPVTVMDELNYMIFGNNMERSQTLNTLKQISKNTDPENSKDGIGKKYLSGFTGIRGTRGISKQEFNIAGAKNNNTNNITANVSYYGTTVDPIAPLEISNEVLRKVQRELDKRKKEQERKLPSEKVALKEWEMENSGIKK